MLLNETNLTISMLSFREFLLLGAWSMLVGKKESLHSRCTTSVCLFIYGFIFRPTSPVPRTVGTVGSLPRTLIQLKLIFSSGTVVRYVHTYTYYTCSSTSTYSRCLPSYHKPHRIGLRVAPAWSMIVLFRLSLSPLCRRRHQANRGCTRLDGALSCFPHIAWCLYF